MRLRLTLLLLLCFALPAYATDTALVDHDGVTQPLVLTPANIGAATAAQGAKADSAVQSASFTSVIAPDHTKKADFYCSDYTNSDCGAALQAAITANPYNAKIEYTPGVYHYLTGVISAGNGITIVSPGEAATHYVDKPITLLTISTGTSSRIYSHRLYGMNMAAVLASSPTVSGNGSIVTVTTGSAHGYTTGDSIWMRGWVGGTGAWNGVYTVAVTDATHFTYAATGSGTPTGGMVSYPATAIKSVKSSQQYLVDCKWTDFATSIYAEEAWDHFITNPQIFNSGSGSTYQTGGHVIRNGSADKTAGYQVIGGRTESWMAGMGSAIVMDGSGSSGLKNDTILFLGHKMENYFTAPVVKASGTTKVRFLGGNVIGVTSNVWDVDSTCSNWKIQDLEIHAADATGRGQAIQSIVKYAGTVLDFSGNTIQGGATNPATVWLTSTAGQSRITGNHINYTARNTPWVQNDSSDGAIVVYGNSYAENITEGLLNLSDVTTANMSTTKHGLAPKAPNDATKFLDGTGAWSVPSGIAGTLVTTIGTPGSDTNVPTEKAVRAAITASNSGVSSVALSLPAEFSVAGSPVTTSGTLAGSWASQTANYGFFAPSGSAGTPSFRLMTAADLGTTLTPQFGTIGVNAANDASAKIYAWGSTGTAIRGNSSTGGTGVKGDTTTGYGVNGTSSGGTAVFGGDSGAGFGVQGQTTTGTAIVGNGNYGTALKVYQFKASMTQSNNNPVAYIQKNLGLNGFTSTGPVLFIENQDSTASANYGPLIQAKKGSTVVFQVDEDGTFATNNKEKIKANGTCSTSINIDPALGGIHTLTLSGACAIGVTNLAAGQSFTLKLTQSSTTAPTFTTPYGWPAGTPPTWSTTAGKYDVLSCQSTDGTTLDCNGMADVRH